MMASENTDRSKTDLSVARTILEHLGKGFALMTGAKDFIGGSKELSFSLPGRPGYVKGGINRVVIRLTPEDLYEAKFFRITKRGINAKLVDSKDYIYCEDLARIFREVTGLETRMPRFA